MVPEARPLVSLHIESLFSFAMSTTAASRPEDWDPLVGAELVFFLCAEYRYVVQSILRFWDLVY